MNEDDLKNGYYLDNFKHPYFRLSHQFTWPSINLIESSQHEVNTIRSILQKYWPNFNGEFAHWKNDIFSGSQKNLSFVYQNERLKEFEMMVELRVLVGYAGGAASDEIIGANRQDRSPEFITDRIYFRLFLMPVEKIQLNDSIVEQIDLLTFSEILEASEYSLTREFKELWTTALFDSIDYSFLQERIKAALDKIAVWKLGNLFMPILIERMTFALNILNLEQAMNMAKPFRELLGVILSGDLIGLESETDWSSYINNWAVERVLSRSGNPHWQFVNFPFM